MEQGELIEGTPLAGKNLPSSLTPRKIMFGVPHKGNASFNFIGGLRTLHMPFDFVDCYSSDNPIDISRNIIVTRALQTNCDYLFFVDSDIILRPDTLSKLLIDDFPIVSAAYRQRVEPYLICAKIGGKTLDPQDLERIQSQNETAIQGEEGRKRFKTIEVEEVGMGCCLIHRIVLLRMAQARNEWRCLLDHTPVLGRPIVTFTDAEAIKQNWLCKFCKNILVCNLFEYRILTGDKDARSEDFVFCIRARQAGFNIFLQVDNVVTHETAPWRVDEKGLINPSVDAAVRTDN